jgi:hypothetical protein
MTFTIPPGNKVSGQTGEISDLNNTYIALAASFAAHGEALTSGEAVFARVAASGSVAMSTEVLVLTYWTAVSSNAACNTVTTATTGTAASGLTYANIGVYSVASNGNLTLVASTGNLSSTLWKSTYTTYVSSLTASFSRSAGLQYALGVLAVGTTPPSLAGAQPAGGFLDVAPLLSGSVSSQSTLPSSLTSGSISAYYLMAEAIVSP